MKNYILDSDLLSKKTTTAYSILFSTLLFLNKIEETSTDAFEEINSHDELGNEDYTSIKSNIEHMQEYMEKYRSFGGVSCGSTGENNSWSYNINNRYESSSGYSTNSGSQSSDSGGFIGEYQREVDDIFYNAQVNAVKKLSDSKLQDIKVNNNVGVQSEVPAALFNMQTKISSGVEKEQIGIEDLFDSGKISLAMQTEYKDMKKDVDAYNESLSEYNSEEHAWYIPEFINKGLYESKIDNYDDYINKMITSSDFDYETEEEKKLSLAIDFIPSFGEGKKLLEAALGEDLVSGRYLSKEDQLIILGTMEREA